MNGWKKRVQRLFGQGSTQDTNKMHQKDTLLTPELVGSMVKGVLSTRSDELDCDECFVELDLFADMYLVGKRPEEALPLVQDHLSRCKDCREEFEALMLALQAS